MSVNDNTFKGLLSIDCSQQSVTDSCADIIKNAVAARNHICAKNGNYGSKITAITSDDGKLVYLAGPDSAVGQLIGSLKKDDIIGDSRVQEFCGHQASLFSNKTKFN